MKAFRFSLERVLGFRETQVRLEQEKLTVALGRLDSVQHQRAECIAARDAAQRSIQGSTVTDGFDLASLNAYRSAMNRRELALLEQSRNCAAAVEQAKRSYIEARRRVRLLDRLKQYRQAEWTSAADRETEATAIESFLSRWPAPVGHCPRDP
jgi:flagellar export protein FliJ